MPFNLVPGNALGCTMNAHRSGWDGSICEGAASWNCGAELHFREDYCERQVPRCFHMHVFDPAQPHLVIPHSGVGWIVEDHPDALQDQILLLWGPIFSEPRGIRESQPRTHVLFGAYRIQSVERSTQQTMVTYRVIPYPEGWVDVHDLHVQRPYYTSAGGSYIKQVDRRAVDRAFREALASAERLWDDPVNADRLRRLRRFADHLDEWFRVARQRAERFSTPPPRPAPGGNLAGSQNLPFKKVAKDLLARVVTTAETPTQTATAKAPPREAAKAAPPSALVEPIIEPLVEPPMREMVSQQFGADTLAAIQVAGITKPIVAFRGEPGVGKSTLALNLVKDPDGERTRVVPVASTWRGREDLLGYVNPIDNLFEPTPFTRFLIEAEEAFDRGDRRQRVVIFEEFNLAQPEYWMSDVLVRSQYPPTERGKRTIDLGGQGLRMGGKIVERSGVWLTPSVRFIATLNADHTTRPLSPRVLDRVAVVELALEPRQALARANVAIEDEMVEAITDLTFCLKGKASAFSFRTALSLRACLPQTGALGLQETDAIDLVLMQEVLTKVRLLAGDPSDHQTVRELVKWAEGSGSKLSRCGAAIASWKERLDEGLDVNQV